MVQQRPQVAVRESRVQGLAAGPWSESARPGKNRLHHTTRLVWRWRFFHPGIHDQRGKGQGRNRNDIAADRAGVCSLVSARLLSFRRKPATPKPGKAGRVLKTRNTVAGFVGTK